MKPLIRKVIADYIQANRQKHAQRITTEPKQRERETEAFQYIINLIQTRNKNQNKNGKLIFNMILKDIKGKRRTPKLAGIFCGWN